MTKNQLENIEKDVKYALRIVGADRPLDWEDRVAAEQALDRALLELELMKQDADESITQINDTMFLEAA